MTTILRAKLIAIALSILAAFNLASLPSTHPLVVRYESAADDVIAAVEAEEPTSTDERKETLARILYVWGYYEGSWYPNPYGFPDGRVLEGTNDGGRACGVMQLHLDEINALVGWKGILDPSWSCRALRKDRLLGFRAGLRVILELERRYGSLGAAMTAYSTDLGSHPWIAAVVKKRCKIAGVVCALP